MIFRRTVTPAGLAEAILTRPQGAWLYYGAVGLDDETRAWFRARPHRLLRISAQAGAFATFGPSLHVRGGRVASPGGPAADPLWKALAGASPADADAFVDKVLEARAGRLASLYDTVYRLDAGRSGTCSKATAPSIGCAASPTSSPASTRNGGSRHRPLSRPLVDPATLLLELEVRPDGSPILPEPAAWTGTFGRPVQVDAAWLVDRVFSGDGSALRDRFDLALFAMRWTRDGREPASRGALDLFVEAPALASTLERIGVRDNAVATRLHGVLQRPDVREDAQAMRLLQVSLALIERPVLAGSFDPSVAGGLLAALVDRVEADGAARGVSAWVSGALAQACRPLAPSETLDGQLATALSGPPPAAPVRVEWEGQRYLVDRAAATRARIERVREAQGRPSVDTAPGDPAVLADRLIALIYASALPATDPELLASRSETRHDFGPPRGAGAQDRRAWRLAEPGAGAPWHLSGSLLGLDVALAVPLAPGQRRSAVADAARRGSRRRSRGRWRCCRRRR